MKRGVIKTEKERKKERKNNRKTEKDGKIERKERETKLNKKNFMRVLTVIY